MDTGVLGEAFERLMGDARLMKLCELQRTGDEVLDVPSGTQHGREFVLKGRGVPRLSQGGRSRGRGDLRARIVVAVPTKLNDAERELLRKFAESRGEQVAPHDGGLKSKIKSAFS